MVSLTAWNFLRRLIYLNLKLEELNQLVLIYRQSQIIREEHLIEDQINS